MAVSVILHFTEQFSYQKEQFQKVLQSIEDQTNLPKELIILDEQNSYNANFKLGSIKIIVIRGEYRNRSQWLNAAIEQSSGSYILYIDKLSVFSGKIYYNYFL